MSSINCTTDDLSSEALLRLVVVDTTGEPYFTCANQEITVDDLVHLLVGKDSNGDKAVRVTLSE